MHTIPDDKTDGRRRRRRHSDEFKAEAVAACMQPGVSVSAIALARGVNANLLRYWLRNAEMKPAARIAAVPVATQTPVATPSKPSFAPMILPAQAPAPPQDIRIELRRNATTVTVTWPMSAASECAAWMREVLR
jgi:transposase